MKIGYDAKRIYHNTTGLGNYCRDMIRILASYHPDHQYFLYNPKAGKVNRLQADGKIVIERQPTTAWWKVMNSLWRQGQVLKDAAKDGAQIYHGLSGELPRGLEKSNIKTVLTVHDLIFVSHPHLYKSIDRKIYLNKLKYAAGQADVIVAISAYTKQQLIDHIGTDSDKIKVIYQTCHQAFKKADGLKDSENLNNLNLPDEYILMVGTIEERKNALALIKAIKGTDYHVVLVGRKTKYTNQIESYIQSNNLNNQVHFINAISIETLAAIYHRAKLMVYTSLTEGFGIPIIEALYTSTPVICHHGGVFPEAAGPDSLYVDMNDPTAIRSIIDRVWNDESLLNKMKINGREYAARFDDKAIADQMMSIYKKLIN